MTQRSILVVGSINMDQIVHVPRMPVLGETLLGAGSLKLVPGGKGANQAAAIARLLPRTQTNTVQTAPSDEQEYTRAHTVEAADASEGIIVKMAGRVGTDAFGAQLLDALRQDQIDTSLTVSDQHASSGAAFIFLSPEGDNAIVVSSGANARVGDDQEQLEQIAGAMQHARALVLQLEIPTETVRRLIEAGHAAGLLVVLNLAPAQRLSQETLRKVSVLVLNESEAGLLSGQRVESVEDAQVVATVLYGYGISTVVITLGAQGAYMVTRDPSGTMQGIYEAAPHVSVVDTTAAGDCFVGALTVALSENQPPAEALRFAVAASALKVTRFGAQSGLPTRAEVLASYQTEQ